MELFVSDIHGNYETFARILRNTPEGTHLHMVGDIYDRGPEPDKVMDALAAWPNLDIQWGNHDVLWMGAALGQPGSVAHAVRICARYGNLSILEDTYGIDLGPLRSFALETYADDPCVAFGLKGNPDLSPEELDATIKIQKAMAFIVAFISLGLGILFTLKPELAGNVKPGIQFVIVMAYMLIASYFNPGMNTRDLIDAIEQGARGIPLVCVACATAGIVLGAVSLTGIGGKLVGFVISFAGNMPLLALILVMLIATLLGMGLPTTGAYILAAALGAPILVKLGFPPIAAHMFVFYYAIISNITPPVALAAYAASSIADSNPNKTGFQAMQLGFLAYVVPFAFCYDPGLLIQGSWAQIGWALISGTGAVFAFAGMWMGYLKTPLNLLMRVLLAVSGVLCLTVWPATTVTGLVILIAVYFLSLKK